MSIDVRDEEPRVFHVLNDGRIVDCGHAEKRIGHWFLDWEKYHYFFAYVQMLPLDYDLNQSVVTYDQYVKDTADVTPNYRDFFGPAGHARYDELQAQIAANKCPCGGSYGGNHLVSWHEEHGWKEAMRREGIDPDD